MNIFSNSDKYNPKFELDSGELDLIDMNHEFHSDLELDKKLFGRFSIDDIREMLYEVNLLNLIEQRGYKDIKIEMNLISDLDNRIYVKTKDDEILIHIRLKADNFYIKKANDHLKLVYIDWLLTQNVRLGKLKEKKILFEGQEFPGLNVFKEITKFITNIVLRIGANGVFNIPEYFHDAILFEKNFKFVDPEKQGIFLALKENFSKKHSLREISILIRDKKIIYKDTKEIYIWKHGETLYTRDNYLNDKIFDAEYVDKVNHYKNTVFEIIH